MAPVARPSIVPIALTLDDRTGYTLWAPPWEEDGEEWQAFLGTTEDDDGGRRCHLFPTPAALAAFCRTSTDHDLADHPVWPVVAGLGAADLTPDDDHRFDLDGVYDIAAESPDRWAVEELAATIDIVSRLAECLDTSGRRGRRAGRRRRPRASSRPSPSSPPSPRSARWASAWTPSSAAPARTPGSASAASWTTCGRTSSRSSPSTSTGPAPARPRSRTTRRPPRSRRSTPDELGGRATGTTTVRRATTARATAPAAAAPGAHHRPRRPDHRLPRRGRRGRPVLGVGRHPAGRGRGPGGRRASPCAATSRTSPGSSAATARCSSSTPPPTSPASARAPRSTTSWRSPPGPRSPTPTSPPLPGRPGPLRPHRAVRGPHRGRRRRGRAGRPPGVRAAGRGRARPRRVRRAHAGSTSCSPPTAPLGRAVARGEREPDADLRAEDAAVAAAAVGRGRHPGQRHAGLPRLTRTFGTGSGVTSSTTKRPAPGDPGTGRFVVQVAQLE